MVVITAFDADSPMTIIIIIKPELDDVKKIMNTRCYISHTYKLYIHTMYVPILLYDCLSLILCIIIVYYDILYIRAH